MADGTRLTFYGVVRLSVRLQDGNTEEDFVVSQISKDTISRMPFLVAHQCAMNFEQPVVTMRGHLLTCTDRQGKLFLSKVQILRDVVVPARMEMTVLCRVINYPLRLIEGCPSGLPLAASFNRHEPKGGMTARCLNLINQPYHLWAGSVVSSYTGVEDHQVDDKPLSSGSRPALGGMEAMPGVKVPDHLKDLYLSAEKNCQELDQLARLGQLLVHYQHTFSRRDEDVGRTSEAEDSIPLKDGTRPIRQLPHRLGQKKEAANEWQVQELLDRGLIEPAGGAWSSPIVLIRKKDEK
ncbi:uncharacterized protein [Watersipora subatra]|uniref:uncharacterized protein n=1 Tax=Watersipora subatra TaxID=2589382 RepID=UPI00355BB233